MAGSIEWLEFWYAALASERGIVIAVSDVHNVKQKLYQARAAANDPDLAGIAIRTSPLLPKEELWLVKQTPVKKASPDGSKS